MFFVFSFRCGLQQRVEIYDVERVVVLVHIVLDTVENDVLWVHTYTFEVFVEDVACNECLRLLPDVAATGVES